MHARTHARVCAHTSGCTTMPAAPFRWSWPHAGAVLMRGPVVVFQCPVLSLQKSAVSTCSMAGLRSWTRIPLWRMRCPWKVGWVGSGGPTGVMLRAWQPHCSAAQGRNAHGMVILGTEVARHTRAPRPRVSVPTRGAIPPIQPSSLLCLVAHRGDPLPTAPRLLAGALQARARNMALHGRGPTMVPPSRVYHACTQWQAVGARCVAVRSPGNPARRCARCLQPWQGHHPSGQVMHACRPGQARAACARAGACRTQHARHACLILGARWP